LKINAIWTTTIFNHLNKKYLFINKNVYYPIIDTFFKFSYNSMYKFFDKGIIEWIGPFGIVIYTNKLIKSGLRIQTGLIYHYFGLIVLSIIILILLLIYNITI
jgi:hypothetical protein